jgi:hypothetical protein
MLVTRLIPKLIGFFSRVGENRLPEPLKERHKEGCAAFTRPDTESGVTLVLVACRRYPARSCDLFPPKVGTVVAPPNSEAVPHARDRTSG